MRVYELSKELGIVNKDLIETAKSIGISLKSHASSIRDDEVIKIKDKLGKSKQPVTEAQNTGPEAVADTKKLKVLKSESGQQDILFFLQAVLF